VLRRVLSGKGDHRGSRESGRSRAGYGGFTLRINNQALAAVLLAAMVVAVLSAPATAAQGKRALVLAFGDSLTSGWGLAAEQAFPSQLQAALRAAGHDVEVVNAGVAGDTTAAAKARLAWSLAPKPNLTPDVAIVEFGANDGLRGIDPATTEAHLDAVLTELNNRGITVLLTGMFAPPNLGREYGTRFNAVFPRLAAKHGVAFYPFFLDGVAAKPSLNQRDGIHPNAKGVAVIVARLMPYVVRVLP